MQYCMCCCCEIGYGPGVESADRMCVSCRTAIYEGVLLIGVTVLAVVVGYELIDYVLGGR